MRFGRPRKLNPKQGTLAQPFSSEGNLVRQVAETFIVHAPTIYPLSGGGRLSVFSVPLLPNTRVLMLVRPMAINYSFGPHKKCSPASCSSTSPP